MEDEALLPKVDYYLDESDPDIVVLRRQVGLFVAAFSAWGPRGRVSWKAAKEDYWKVIETNACGCYGRKKEMLTAPDRALTRSSCPFPGPTKGSRRKSNARRGGCTMPAWPCGLRT